MIYAVLWLLATLDAGFSGYRAAAGRDARIYKRAYYRKAVLRGVLQGQLALLYVGGIFLFPRLLLPLVMAVEGEHLDEIYLYLEGLFRRGAAAALWIYLPYAAVVALGMAMRQLPSVDLRSATSVAIFGPVTLARPFVALAGLIAAALAQPAPIVVVALAVGVVMVFSVERTLGRSWAVGAAGNAP